MRIDWITFGCANDRQRSAAKTHKPSAGSACLMRQQSSTWRLNQRTAAIEHCAGRRQSDALTAASGAHVCVRQGWVCWCATRARRSLSPAQSLRSYRWQWLRAQIEYRRIRVCAVNPQHPQQRPTDHRRHSALWLHSADQPPPPPPPPSGLVPVSDRVPYSDRQPTATQHVLNRLSATTTRVAGVRSLSSVTSVCVWAARQDDRLLAGWSARPDAVVPRLRASVVYHPRRFGVRLEASALCVQLKRRRRTLTSRNFIHSFVVVVVAFDADELLHHRRLVQPQLLWRHERKNMTSPGVTCRQLVLVLTWFAHAASDSFASGSMKLRQYDVYFVVEFRDNLTSNNNNNNNNNSICIAP